MQRQPDPPAPHLVRFTHSQCQLIHPSIHPHECPQAVPPNKAATARRRVQVVCGSSEHICPDEDGAGLSCSFGGICGLGSFMKGASASSATGQLGPGSSQLPASASITAASSTAPPVIPTLTLIGPATVNIPMGTPYSKCQMGLISGCDQGVRATALIPGDLNSQVSGLGAATG